MNMRTPRQLLPCDDDNSIEIPQQDVDFSEYMWMMEEMEEFDRQVTEELQEQEMMEQGFQDLYDMEQMASDLLSSSPVQSALITFELPGAGEGVRCSGMVNARQDACSRTVAATTAALASSGGEQVATSSKLNPLAPEFKPRGEC